MKNLMLVLAASAGSIDGDPTREPAAIRRVVTVFRRGPGSDAGKLSASVKGLVGLR